MPELPEVETVVRELKTYLPGKKIKRISVYWHKTFVNGCTQKAEGQTIQSLSRRGKYILISLNRSALIVHLRMTGQLLFLQKEATAKNALHVRTALHFEDGSVLLFNDVRKFGRIYHVHSVNEKLDRLGVDALDPQFNASGFYTMLQAANMNIKAFLLSQRFVSGLGNIYVDESLFRAEIHPASVSKKISRKKAEKLFDTMRSVLEFAILNMGSTISDYRDANGNVGNAQHFFYVYQQQGKPCVTCGSAIKKMKHAGRGTHFCPKCQTLYV